MGRYYSNALFALLCLRLRARFEKPEDLRAGIGAKALRLFDRVGAPEMAGARHDDRARIEAGLFESGQEFLRLRGRIDDVVFPSVNQQKARAVLVDGDIAQWRRLEICPSAHHRRAAEQFLGDLIARARDLVVLPLRQHVIDAVKSDDRLDLGEACGVAITLILARKQWFVAGERDERGEVCAGGIADQPDAAGIEAELGSPGAHKLHRRHHIADCAGPGLHTRSHQPVLDRKDRITVPREVIAPVRIEFAVADLPAAAMHADQYRRFGEALWPV